MDRKQVIEYYQNPAYVDQNEAHSHTKKDEKLAGLRGLMNDSGRVVELGCGAGVYSEISPNYVGLDISHEAVRRFGKGIVCDVAWMPLKEGTATTVFSFYTLEHVYDPARVIAEVDRVLGPGGVAILKDAWLKTSKTEAGPRVVRKYWENFLSRLGRIWRTIIGSDRIVYHRMKPDYTKIGEDYDAVSRIDPHSVFRWFRARGYEAVNQRRGILGLVRLYRMKKNWVICRKP